MLCEHETKKNILTKIDQNGSIGRCLDCGRMRGDSAPYILAYSF